MLNAIAKVVAMIVKNTAISACGAASNWNAYQPQEPAVLKEMLK